MSEPVAAPALLRTPSHPAGAWCACAMVASGAAIVLWTSATVGYGGPAAVALLTALTTPADPPSFALCVWWPGGAAGSLGRWIWINRVCATHCGGGAGGCPPPKRALDRRKWRGEGVWSPRGTVGVAKWAHPQVPSASA